MIRAARIALGAVLALWLVAVPASAAPSPTAPISAEVATIERGMASDPEQAVALARAARARLAGPAGDGVQAAALSWLEGEGLIRIGAPRDGLVALERAELLARRSGAPPHLIADILLSRGSGLTDAGRITDALTTLQRAHDMFLSLNDPRSRARALTLIALLYVSGHDYETALRYFDQAGEVYPNDAGLAVSVDNGRGNALLALGKYQAAEAQFRAALSAARALRSAPVEAQTLGNLTMAQLRAGDAAGAGPNIARALTLAERPDSIAIRPQLLVLAAQLALLRGDRDAALRLVRERFAGVDPSATMPADRDAHDIAYRTYLATGAPEQAVPHLLALRRLDEQATELARSTSAALATARFDYASQELRIARLKATALQRRVAFERATAETQRLIFYGVVGTTLAVITLLAVGLALIGRSRNRERAANRELAASNAQLEKLSRAKTEFLATTSHEIRTPLNGILGMTQVMLADGGLDRVTRDRLGVVHGAGLTMRALVDDILDMAKIETGRMTIETAPLDLHETVGEAARLWRDPAQAKGLRFDMDLGDTPRWIIGDAARLRQIVFNLLSNAVKFTDSGSVTLGLSRQDGRLRIDVGDSGVGIDADAQRIIFESFRQADSGTTRRFGGTGLGLSICRSLAQAMGGDVTVDSTIGVGSRFTLDLPCVAAAPSRVETATGGLLIVERNPIARAMYRALFADRPTLMFSDAETVVADVQRACPERILIDAATLDIASPLIVDVVAAAHGAPVAMLTPALDDPVRRDLYARGVTKVIEKPVSKRGLVDAIGALPNATIQDAA